jgi:uncharacterized membrane protein
LDVAETVATRDLAIRLHALRTEPARSFRRDWDLWGAAVLAAALAANNAIAPNTATVLSVVLGLLIGLVAPGYALIGLLQARRGDLDELERWGLSLVLTVVVVMISALLLSEAHVRLDARRMTTALAVETVILAAAGVCRRSMLPPGEAYAPRLPRNRGPYLTLVLAVALGVTTWQVVSTAYGTKSTSFSITSPSGQLSGYPFQIRIGSSYPLTLHIDNPTGQAVRYRLVVSSSGGAGAASGSVRVAAHGAWSERVLLATGPPARSEIARFALFQGTRATRVLWIRYRIVP